MKAPPHAIPVAIRSGTIRLPKNCRKAHVLRPLSRCGCCNAVGTEPGAKAAWLLLLISNHWDLKHTVGVEVPKAMNSQSIYSSHFREEPEEEESEPFYTGDEMPNDIRRLIHNVSTGQQRFADAELHLRSQLHAAEVEQSRCRDRLEEMMGHAFAADIWDSVSVSPVKLTEDERPLVRELARARVMVQRYNSYLEALLQQFGDDTRVIALSDRVLELEEQVRVLKHQSKELAQWRLKARSPRAWLGECKRQEEERHLMAAKSQRTEEEHKVCHEVTTRA